MMTRIGYCEKCFKKMKPQRGQRLLILGGSSNEWKALITTKVVKAGFTPHLYMFIRESKHFVYYYKMCCMEGCGCYTEQEGKYIYVMLNEEGFGELQKMRLCDWNSLVLFTDTGLKICE